MTMISEKHKKCNSIELPLQNCHRQFITQSPFIIFSSPLFINNKLCEIISSVNKHESCIKKENKHVRAYHYRRVGKKHNYYVFSAIL